MGRQLALCRGAVGISQKAKALSKFPMKRRRDMLTWGAQRRDSQHANIMSKTSQYFESLTWDQIVWSHSYEKVRRMQKRIFKACRAGDTGRLWFLQKLLIKNPHAKLIAVHKVTTLNKGKKTAGVDRIKVTTAKQKLELSKNLQLNGKANQVRRATTLPEKYEKPALGIPTVNDRAKQALCLLALEPEWEAKFESNSYGFRPGRSAHDAIEAIYSNLHHNTDKYVFNAGIRKCFDKIDHNALLLKLATFPLMERQVSAWLKAGIMDEYAETEKISKSDMGTPQSGVISPLLANVALHGLEDHLLAFVLSRKMPKPHPGSARGLKAKTAALAIIRYADDFVIIHRNKEIIEMVIEETKNWLKIVGLEISQEKSALRLASQSFSFLGFSISYAKVQGRFRVKIKPSKKNIQNIVQKTRNILQCNKSASAYKLIGLLRPVLIGWGNYFHFCECQTTFSKVDNLIWQQLRAWVFRRAIRQGRTVVKEKYFPVGKTYVFQGREYKSNWILNGSKKLEGGGKMEIHLPKISWIKSAKFVKVKGTSSIYDENEVYWALRMPRYSILVVKNLLNRQRGMCNACKKGFIPGDFMEVDHILPRTSGGLDHYNNLQLLHRQCHVTKTKLELGKPASAG